MALIGDGYLGYDCRSPGRNQPFRSPDAVSSVESQGAMNRSSITISPTKLEQFCRDHHIRRLALFGSVLRDDFRADSDVDILVEFEAGRTPGYQFWVIEEELTEMFGRKVDLNTLGFLSRYFRDRVQKEAQVLYAKE